MSRWPGLERGRTLLVLCLLLLGLQQLASAGYIQAKARLAQLLIARAWDETLQAGGSPAKPWPWADTWPVARLEVPRHRVDLYVLSGAGGNALAFGPGHASASSAPGERGTTVIGGHRDTHFTFLRELQTNTLLSLQLPSGEFRHWRVAQINIVDSEREPLQLAAAEVSELLLVTCYPFDTLRVGGPLRYVVRARPVAAALRSAPALSQQPIYPSSERVLEL